MFRSLFSIAAICSLLFVSLGAPAARAASKRCPEEPPSSILSLFKASDAVYIGRFDKTTDGDVVRTDEDSSTVSVSQHFSISTTIKGESKKFFVRTYDDYRYHPAVPEPAAELDAAQQEAATDEMEEADEEFEDEDYRPLKTGDTVLLFLKYAEDEEDTPAAKKGKKTLDLAHYRDGIKRLDEKEFASYEARVRELKGIFSKKKVNDADILNWIIRCIDDPFTRWEGAYELQSSFENLDWQERSKTQHEDADAAKTGDSETELAADHNEEAIIEEEDDVFDNSVYAKLLTDAQKTRLMQIALSSKPAAGEEELQVRSGRDGDRLLFEVVKRWGDSKLASAMLDRLRSAGDDNYDKFTWMTSIAEILKDSELSSISDKFGNVTYQADEEEMFGSDDEETVVDGPATERSGEPDPESPEPVTKKDESEAVDKPAKKTYKQYRDELLAEFFAKATAVITQETENAKA